MNKNVLSVMAMGSVLVMTNGAWADSDDPIAALKSAASASESQLNTALNGAKTACAALYMPSAPNGNQTSKDSTPQKNPFSRDNIQTRFLSSTDSSQYNVLVPGAVNTFGTNIAAYKAQIDSGIAGMKTVKNSLTSNGGVSSGGLQDGGSTATEQGNLANGSATSVQSGITDLLKTLTLQSSDLNTAAQNDLKNCDLSYTTDPDHKNCVTFIQDTVSALTNAPSGASIQGCKNSLPALTAAAQTAAGLGTQVASGGQSSNTTGADTKGTASTNPNSAPSNAQLAQALGAQQTQPQTSICLSAPSLCMPSQSGQGSGQGSGGSGQNGGGGSGQNSGSSAPASQAATPASNTTPQTTASTDTPTPVPTPTPTPDAVAANPKLGTCYTVNSSDAVPGYTYVPAPSGSSFSPTDTGAAYDPNGQIWCVKTALPTTGVLSTPVVASTNQTSNSSTAASPTIITAFPTTTSNTSSTLISSNSTGASSSTLVSANTSTSTPASSAIVSSSGNRALLDVSCPGDVCGKSLSQRAHAQSIMDYINQFPVQPSQ